MRRRAVQVLDDPSWQRVGRGQEVEALPHVRVAVEVERVSRLHEELDDLGELDVEERWQLRARRDHLVQVECRRNEVGAEVAGGVADGVALDELAAHEERRAQLMLHLARRRR